MYQRTISTFLTIMKKAVMNIHMFLCFHYFWVQKEWNSWVICLSLEKLSDCFPKQLHNFTFSPARMYEGSNFPTSSPTLSALF